MSEINSTNAAKYYTRVIRLHLSGMGSTKISRIIPVSKPTIDRWIRNFAHEHQCSVKMSRKLHLKTLPTSESLRMDNDSMSNELENSHPSQPSPTTNLDVASLQAEISRLKSQLAQASLRADAFDELINVAEKQFNISIRKKAGAKQ